MGQNLEDIAKIAGVSRSTVSRVINKSPHVNEETRQKVLEIIREQQFRPNLAARALVTRHTRVLSIVIPQAVGAAFTDPYFPALIDSITHRASQQDYAVMLWIGKDTEEEERFGDRILNHVLFDGMIVTSSVDNDPLVTRLFKAGFPCVLIGPPYLENMCYVDVDNLGGAQIAVSHLLSLKRKHIGTITGPLNMGASKNRLKGYQVAMLERGLPIHDKLIAEGNFDEPSGYQCASQLLDNGVDAIFAASDIMALGALKAIKDRGLRVPEDIALVGFDDMAFATTITPALTTVRQSISDLGIMAANILIGMLDENLHTPRQVFLPTQLIVRDSCGAKLSKR